MKPIAIFLAEKLEDIVSNEDWLLVNNAADELRRLQAKVEQLEAAQPSKPWVGLTVREIEWCFEDANGDSVVAARNIEAKLREKNA